MNQITLYNTRTRRKDPLVPLDPSNVRMYVCGPTVYDRAHIGNARPVVVFDTLFRLLRHVYGEPNVTYVRNITDVEDKINARAAAAGRPIHEITEETIRWYHEDMAAVGALPPTHEPRATAFIGPMIEIIGTLIARGHAYEAEGHVLFAVASYPDYGKLARRSLDEMRAGARVEVAPYKRDPMDFVLWKPSDTATPGWDSPWGRGRPGWHIECSAMAQELLGPSFDIHGGGIDLAFPHHENEMAQSRCAHPEGDFAHIWMHNGFLNVEGEKMSKSLGNFFTVRDLLDRGVPGEVMRFVLLSTHYRQPMDWTEAKVAEATALLTNWDFLLRSARKAGKLQEDAPHEPAREVLDALADDLNTPLAITHLHNLTREVRLDEPKAVGKFLASLELLGVQPARVREEAIQRAVQNAIDAVGLTDENSLRRQVSILVEARTRAREAQDFKKADSIRDRLSAAGVIVMDRVKSDTDWELGPDFDPSKLSGDDE